MTTISTLVLGTLLGTFSNGTPSGSIEGHVHYPACTPPADLMVCAEPSDEAMDEVRVCTDAFERTSKGLRYVLTVPPGTWWVYAVAPEQLPDHRAYYSRAVACGLTVRCKDHRPLPVEVEAGSTARGVNPDDWFGPRRVEPRLDDALSALQSAL